MPLEPGPTFYILTLAGSSFAQIPPAHVSLPNGAILTMQRVPFRATGHRMSYSLAKDVVAIDGRRVVGTDGELPRYELASASLMLRGVRYRLPVQGMYNPWFDDGPSPRLFRLVRQPHGYLLWAMFSDGAGSYTSKWCIQGKSAKRILLSTDERYCF